MENLEKVEEAIRLSLGAAGREKTLESNVLAIDVTRESKGTIEALKVEAEALLESFLATDAILSSVDTTNISQTGTSSNILPARSLTSIASLRSIIATLNNYLAVLDAAGPTTPAPTDPSAPTTPGPTDPAEDEKPAPTANEYVTRFKAVAGASYDYSLETTLFLDWLYTQAGSSQSLLNGTDAYSRFVAARNRFASQFHNKGYGDITISVNSQVPWNVELTAWPLNSGTSYNGAYAASGNRTLIAGIAIELTEYFLLTPAQYYRDHAGSAVAGLIEYLYYPSGAYYNSAHVGRQAYSYGYNSVYLGFFTASVTVKSLPQYKNIVVLDGELFGYAPITGASQAGSTVSFSTNHAGYFWVFGTKSSDNPQTSDTSNIALYSMLALVSLAGIAAVNRKKAFDL
jgi:hypothetical protein